MDMVISSSFVVQAQRRNKMNVKHKRLLVYLGVLTLFLIQIWYLLSLDNEIVRAMYTIVFGLQDGYILSSLWSLGRFVV
jgi:hypothetical protein